MAVRFVPVLQKEKNRNFTTIYCTIFLNPFNWLLPDSYIKALREIENV